MKAVWAIVGGLVLGAGIAWWLSRPSARVAEARQAHAEQAAAANRPSLYRWRDGHGVLQVTDHPPKGIRYQRVPIQSSDGIEVHGDRP